MDYEGRSGTTPDIAPAFKVRDIIRPIGEKGADRLLVEVNDHNALKEYFTLPLTELYRTAKPPGPARRA